MAEFSFKIVFDNGAEDSQVFQDAEQVIKLYERCVAEDGTVECIVTNLDTGLVVRRYMKSNGRPIDEILRFGKGV